MTVLPTSHIVTRSLRPACPSGILPEEVDHGQNARGARGLQARITLRRRERASTLLLVLWAIMLMSIAVMGLVDHLERGTNESLAAEKEFRVRLLLQSARTVAAHPALQRGDPLLRQKVSALSSYEIKFSSEGVRLAINELPNNRLQQRFAQNLFEQWGLTSEQARLLVESICDWIDRDSRPRPQGAERDYYTGVGRPDFPFNKPFANINDLLLVRGAEEMDRRHSSWRDAFTLYGDGSIDVHQAPSEMLEALFDVTPAEVSRFLESRLGPDGLPETKDDPVFTSLAQVRTLLDVPEANYRRASRLLTLDHPVKRTECLARAGTTERRLTIISGPGVNLITEE